MSFFKTKSEKEIIAAMEREEQSEVFTEQINALKNSQTTYARIAAEAELNGDMASYDTAVNALLDTKENISLLNQMKTNYDIMKVANSTAVCMATAMNSLDRMANNQSKMPNIRKVQKAQTKINRYMRNLRVTQKAMGGAMTRSNPANRARSQEELNSVRPLIESERAKLIPSVSSDGLFNLEKEIEAQKNNII